MKMKDDHIIELLPDFLDNTLTSEERNSVALHLKECKSCTKEFRKTEALFNAIREEEATIPSDRIKDNFLRMLEREKLGKSKVVSFNQKKTGTYGFLRIAAGIALLIGSFLLGNIVQQQRLDKRIAALEGSSLDIKQTAMLSLMENQSASRRIQGVNYIEDFQNPDKAIVIALINRMLHDENTNVRLSAAEALERFTSSEAVKKAFITALEKEKEPAIQIILIQTLVEIQEKKAVQPMQKLLEQQETQPFIKRQIKSLLPSII